MATGDLVTLADVKAYLGGDLQSNNDAVLSRLITAASRFFETACGRRILLQTYAELHDGAGGCRLHLRQTPVVSVASLTIGSLTVPPSAGFGAAGWVIDGDVLVLRGHSFWRGAANVAVTYDAGWQSPPADVAEAVMELVGLRYRGRDRLGKVSESMGGIATTSYAQRDVSPFVASVIARCVKANLA